MNKIEAFVQSWNDQDLREINRHLQTLEKRLYKTYEPSVASRDDYFSRLGKWLGNVATDDDRKTLFRLAPEIFFIGPSEFQALYRLAYESTIARWLIDKAGIDILSGASQAELRQAVEQTWFCPVSDSMRINAFYHVNNVPPGFDFRPDWRSLAKFAEMHRIADYCAQSQIRRIVLLEDFVGGGSQAEDALEFACQALPGVEILFVPLVICPSGLRHLQGLEQQQTNLAIEPLLALPERAFFTTTNSPFDQAQTDALHDLIRRTYAQVCDGAPIGAPPYHAYGYPDGHPTGGLVVAFSNAPDNTLPLIHHRSQQWEPVFPRHCRV